ncbi:MAG TPA: cell division protein ZapA [Alphaproteobacteria bacterium]|nr:cell division protein ZapA [Alphaproteobacteria bacterium]
MAKVDININGRVFAVACDEGQEDRVRELAGMLDSRARLLASQSTPGTVGETHLLVLAGLMLADELTEARALADNRRPGDEDQELLIAAVDHLTDRIGVIATRLERA